MNIREKCEKVKVHPEKLVDYYFCDNCDNKSKIIDWSCAICCKYVSYSFDLCNDCHKLSIDPSKEKELKSNGEHDFKTYVMIRITYTMNTEY
jgi:hypothetical protein